MASAENRYQTDTERAQDSTVAKINKIGPLEFAFKVIGLR